MLFKKFWGVAGDLVSLNRYSGILKQKHISKKSDNNNFQQTDDFFRVIIEAMVIALYMYIAGCSTISKLQTWIGRFNWPTLISKVEHNHLGVFKVQYIRDKASWTPFSTVTNMLDAKKREWLESGDGQWRQEPNWTAVEKRLLAETAPKNRNIIRENALLLLSCGLLYLDLADACQKGYSGRVEKCVSYLAVIYQSSNNIRYATEMMHIVACFKKLWKTDLKQAWLDYSLINPSGKANKFMADDRFGERIILLNKEKIRPSANAKSDEFLREIVAMNVISL